MVPSASVALSPIPFGKGKSMYRLGALLAIFGFGSALLHFTSVQFNLLMWAEPMQPVFGLAIGGAGAVVLLIKVLATKEEPGQAVDGSGQPPMAGPPQQYGPPPGAPVGPPAGPPQQYGPPQRYGPPPGPQQFGPPSGPQRRPGPPAGPPQQRPGAPVPPQQYGQQGGFGPQG
jgi:hypothetical protein